MAVARGTLATFLTKALTLLVTLWLTPFVLRHIGAGDYGYWVIIGQALGYLGVLDFGLTGTVTTSVARCPADEPARLSRLVSSALALHTLVGMAVFVVGLVGAPLFRDWGHGGRALTDVMQVFMLAVLAFAIGFPLRTLQCSIRGRQHITTIRLIDFALFAGKTLLIVLLLDRGMGLMALPTASLLVNTAGIAVYLHFAYRAAPGLQLSARLVTREEIRGLYRPSGWMFVGGMAALAIYSTDALLIGVLLSPAAVTGYTLTIRLSQIAREQVYEVSGLLSPGYGDLVGKGRFDLLRPTYLLTTKLIVGLCLIAAVGIAFFNGDFVRLWVGDRYHGGELLVLAAAVTLLPMATFHTASVVVVSTLDIRRMALVRVAEGVLNLAVTALLIPRLGAPGAALGTLTAALLVSGWYVPVLAARAIALPMGQWLRNLLPALPLTLALAAAGAALSFGGAGGWLELAVRGGAYAAAAAALFVFLYLGRADRAWLLARLGVRRAATAAAAG